MQSFTLTDDGFVPAGAIFAGQSVLPDDSILLQRTPFTLNVDWEFFFGACRRLSQENQPRFVLVDASWDPFRLANQTISERRMELAEIWPGSKVLVLSARAQHFYDDLPGCVYFPLFLMVHYPPSDPRPRSGRIGCLNKRNAAHRVWLMHHLLDQALIDPERDVYSVRFTCMRSNSYWDVDGWAGTDWFNQAQQRWPTGIATHLDDWPNDYSIGHPAWHTGIAIITETEPSIDTIISEKTGKGILSKSCFSIYMADVGYRVLEDLGFQPRFWPTHAEEHHIEPLLAICREIRTEDHAMQYRQQCLDQVQHNFDWFGPDTESFASRPWFDRFSPKLSQALGNL